MNSVPIPELTPLQTRKRTAILEGAKAVFLRDGFGLATMDDVAAAAGVGKQTVYRHFGSKEALFLGLVQAMCADAISATAVPAHPAKRLIDDELRALGQLLARSLIAPDSLGLYRAVVAEAGRLPALGAIFYEHGPRLARSMAAKILAKRFDEQTAAARASTFVALVLGDVHLEMTLGYEVPDFKARFKKQIEEAIQAALR
jgi:TetR/AcrR family transcriptional regulator, mexJK operon transcriptional repressor